MTQSKVRDPYDRRDDPKARLNLIRLRSHRLIAEKIDADPGQSRR